MPDPSTVSIDSIDWDDRDTAIVTWRFDHSDFVSTSVATVEFEPADRSVGIDYGYWTADSDGPAQLDALIAEAASLRACDDGEWERDDGPEREYDDHPEPLEY